MLKQTPNRSGANTGKPVVYIDRKLKKPLQTMLFFKPKELNKFEFNLQKKGLKK